jgi:hypothetical protein
VTPSGPKTIASDVEVLMAGLPDVAQMERRAETA